MKVILQRDVAKIGRRFEVVEVPDGFALNKLIPQGDAKAATAANLKSVQAQEKKSIQDKDQILAKFKNICTELSKETFAISAVANKEEHLFKAVSAEDIVGAAKEQGINLPKEYVVIETPIKALGETQIILRCLNESFTLPINVVAK